MYTVNIDINEIKYQMKRPIKNRKQYFDNYFLPDKML